MQRCHSCNIPHSEARKLWAHIQVRTPHTPYSAGTPHNFVPFICAYFFVQRWGGKRAISFACRVWHLSWVFAVADVRESFLADGVARLVGLVPL